MEARTTEFLAGVGAPPSGVPPPPRGLNTVHLTATNCKADQSPEEAYHKADHHLPRGETKTDTYLTSDICTSALRHPRSQTSQAACPSVIAGILIPGWFSSLAQSPSRSDSGPSKTYNPSLAESPVSSVSSKCFFRPSVRVRSLRLCLPLQPPPDWPFPSHTQTTRYMVYGEASPRSFCG